MNRSSVLTAALGAWAASRLLAHLRRRRVLGRLVPAAAPTLRAPARLADAVVSADLGVDADDIASIWAAAVAVAVVSVAAIGAAGVVVLLVVVAGPPALLTMRRGRRNLRRRSELPVFADATASAVRGGASLASALAAAGAAVSGPLVDDLDDLTRQIDRGLPVAHAFTSWATDPDPDVRLTGRAISMVAEHGGRAGDALERTATVLRNRDELRRTRSGMAVQARSSAAVMTVAPVAFAVVSGATDPRTLRFLVGTPTGLTCLVVGLGLDLAGARWMSAIARSAT